MPKKIVKTKKWNSNDMASAIRDVESGINIREAARRHGMSEGAIRRKKKLAAEGHEFVGSGRKQALSIEQERDLARCIGSLCKLGFSPTQSDIMDLVKEFVEINKIPNPFKINHPGRDWLKAFVKRNNISIKQATLISSARKSATENPFVIYDFYEVLSKLMTEKNYPAENVWNCDESSFPSDPKKIKVVSVRGEPGYRVTAGAGRENTTTLAVANAAGKALPPLIVFQGKNFQSTWRGESALPGTWYGCSENGWMTTDLFAEWFSEFCRTVKERPLLLMYDGHLTHVSLAVVKKAREEDIAIVKFPPHVTDLLQPLDVTCFGPLKSEWSKFLGNWSSAFGDREPIRKSKFVTKLGEIWYKGLTKNNIIAGFRTTGIFPLDPEKYPQSRFDPRLLKRYHTWVELGKPEDLHEAMAMSPETPSKARKQLPKPIDASLPSSSPISSSTPSQPSLQLEPGPSHSSTEPSLQLEPGPSHSPTAVLPTSLLNLCELCKIKENKPAPVHGKMWQLSLSWNLVDIPKTAPPSNKSFEDLVMDKIKGPKDKPVKKRRKVDLKTKVITDDEYLKELERMEAEDEEKKRKKQKKSSKKKIDFRKASKDNDEDDADEEIPLFSDEESNDESDGDLNKEDCLDKVETDLIQFWKSLSPPIPESEIVGKWFAAIYETKKKVQLYIGKATNRFLNDEKGPVESLSLDCLKLHVGTDEVLEELPEHLPRDIGIFPIANVISGPLTAISEKKGKWRIPGYTEIKRLFEAVSKRDRDSIYTNYF